MLLELGAWNSSLRGSLLGCGPCVLINYQLAVVVISHYEKNSDLCLSLIIAFAQWNTSLIALYVRTYEYMISRTNALSKAGRTCLCARIHSRRSAMRPGNSDLQCSLPVLHSAWCTSQWGLIAWFVLLASLLSFPCYVPFLWSQA